MNRIRAELYRAGLVRSSSERLLGGVCGGLATKTGISPNLMRVIVLIAMVIIPGSPLVLYPIAWFLMPEDTFRAQGVDPQATMPVPPPAPTSFSQPVPPPPAPSFAPQPTAAPESSAGPSTPQ